MAEGELPGSDSRPREGETSTSGREGEAPPKKGEGGSWPRYVEDFGRRFGLAKTVTRASAGLVTCEANIGQAADWLAAAGRLKPPSVAEYDRAPYARWRNLKDAGLRSWAIAGKAGKSSSSLTHPGLLLARVPVKEGSPLIFVCAAANYHEALVGDDEPWLFERVTQATKRGHDMHTERFCLVRLYHFIVEQGAMPAGTINLVWVLEKPMCLDGCVPVLTNFIAHWKGVGVQVASAVVESDEYFKKTMAKAIKNFDL